MKKLSILLLLASTQVHAMWTEDQFGNPIRAKGHKVNVANFKTNTEKRAERLAKADKTKAAKGYYVQISFDEPAPNAKPIPKLDNVPFKADIAKGELAVDLKGKKVAGQSQRDIDCLAYSIFREAGNLNENAQLAVGQVHINRLREGTWGDTMCKVVYSPKQFSWTDERLIQWSQEQKNKYVAEAQALMNGLRVKKLESEDVLHYHANYVNPRWARQGQVVAKAGPHLFYKNVPY